MKTLISALLVVCVTSACAQPQPQRPQVRTRAQPPLTPPPVPVARDGPPAPARVAIDGVFRVLIEDGPGGVAIQHYAVVTPCGTHHQLLLTIAPPFRNGQPIHVEGRLAGDGMLTDMTIQTLGLVPTEPPSSTAPARC